MATLDDVATFVASAASLTIGTTLFKGTMPATPETCTAIYEYSGLPPDHVFGSTAIACEYPRLQIVCRGPKDDYQTPRATAETIYRALAAARNQTLTSTRYQHLSPLQSPFLMGRDANARILVGFNVDCAKELSA